MSDIVQRLREDHCHCDTHPRYMGQKCTPCEAADTIERLRILESSAPLQEKYDAQNPCEHIKGFPCGDCGADAPADPVTTERVLMAFIGGRWHEVLKEEAEAAKKVGLEAAWFEKKERA